jgi:hypothetical protein
LPERWRHVPDVAWTIVHATDRCDEALAYRLARTPRRNRNHVANLAPWIKLRVALYALKP